MILLKAFRTITAVIVLLFSISCTPQLSKYWKDEQAVPKKYDRIMIMLLQQENDREVADKMKDMLIKNFSEKEFITMGSLKKYESLTGDFITGAKLFNLRDSNINALITIRLVDVEMEHYYAEDQYGNKAKIFRLYEPDVWAKRKMRWDCNFYDLNNGTLLYHIQTKPFSNDKAENFLKPDCRLIADHLIQNLLAR
ncbi:MAG: hypothetical protein ABJA78_13285 [Ferruginibacter sp.]